MKVIIGVAAVLLALHCGGKGNTNNIQSAAWSGDLARVEKYLADNPQILQSKEGALTLTAAANGGQSEMVEFLISKGTDVNEKGFEDMTPLASISSGFRLSDDKKAAQVAAVLLAHGAEVGPVDAYNDTPLLHAVEANKSKLVQVLLEHGANPTNRFGGTYAGMTPLHMAVLHGQTETVKALLKFQPPLEALDRADETPLMLAELHDRTEIAAMIRALTHDTNTIPSRADMRALAARTADGDAAAFAELAATATNLNKLIKPDTNRFPHPPSPYGILNRDRMLAASRVLGEAAGKGNPKAFEALKQCVDTRNSFYWAALDAFGFAAAAGNKDALDLLFKLNVPPGDINGYLRWPAAANIKPAVDYFINWLRTVKPDERGSGMALWATEALGSAAALGNQEAKAALEKYRSASVSSL